MSLRDKTRYLYALLYTLPFGILAVFYGVQGMVNKSNVNNLPKISGHIFFSGQKQMYFKYAKGTVNAFVITIINKNDTVTCNTTVTDDINILTTLPEKTKKNITVWYDPDIENKISQVEIENKIILPYYSPFMLYLGFTIVGVIFILAVLIYVISNPIKRNI
jgi:hypothetical protein